MSKEKQLLDDKDDLLDHEEDPLEYAFTYNPRPSPFRESGLNPWARACFVKQTGWLDRLRAEAVADLERLQEQLDHIGAMPFEDRGPMLDSILRQTEGACRQVQRIDMLCNLVRPTIEQEKPWQLRYRIAATVRQLRSAA